MKKQQSAGRVFVQNRHVTVAVSTRLVQSAALCAMGPLALMHNLSVVIADDRTVSALNRRFTGRGGPTDVLAFPIDGPHEGGSVKASGRVPLLGEVIVSPGEAKRMCGHYGLTPAQELILYVIHGILHLRGYDDHNDSDRARMRKAELRVMKKVFPGLPATVLKKDRVAFVGTSPNQASPRKHPSCRKAHPEQRRGTPRFC
jgi:probable rRNA maturation factor